MRARKADREPHRSALPVREERKRRSNEAPAHRSHSPLYRTNLLLVDDRVRRARIRINIDFFVASIEHCFGDRTWAGFRDGFGSADAFE